VVDPQYIPESGKNFVPLQSKPIAEEFDYCDRVSLEFQLRFEIDVVQFVKSCDRYSLV
jgi:hypothetical protein